MLPSTGVYTVTPEKTHYTFSPTSITYNTLTKDETSTDFEAIFDQWNISGTIGDGISPISNVAVSITKDGVSAGGTSTNTSGQYSFNNLDAGATYIITPSHAHYNFSPIDRTIIDLSNNVNNADFTGNIHKWDIIGNVVNDSGTSMINVLLSLNKNGISDTNTHTNLLGNYIFSALDAGSTYSITPSSIHYTFSPTQNSYLDLNVNIANSDFTGTKNIWTISGTIYESADPLYDIMVILSGAKNDSQITGITGYYEFADLLAGATYTVTAQKDNYKLIPDNASFIDLSSDIIYNFESEKIFAKTLGDLIVYPNPCIVKEFAHIVFDNLTENCQISIYSIAGELVFSGENDSIEYLWYLNNSNDKDISSGIYFYVVTDENSVKTGKIAIVK